MKYIERNYEYTPVKDFVNNVQNKISVNETIVEVYKHGEIIGWQIEPLIKKIGGI